MVTVVNHVFYAASGAFEVRFEGAKLDDKIPARQRCQVFFEVPAAAKVSP
ncbi:hypothetical protein [Mesorhizobium sp. ANAO-SY3R2]